MITLFVDYHKNRSILDFKYIDSVFINDEREQLNEAIKEHPLSIIRMPHNDISGCYGGAVPANWDGSIIQLR